MCFYFWQTFCDLYFSLFSIPVHKFETPRNYLHRADTEYQLLKYLDEGDPASVPLSNYMDVCTLLVDSIIFHFVFCFTLDEVDCLV